MAKTAEQIAREEADARLTPEEKEKLYQDALRARDALAPAPKSVVWRYADGSERVGTPPFPDLSPIEERESKLERVGAPAMVQTTYNGMEVQGPGANLPTSRPGVSIEEMAERAQNQLNADLVSGKPVNIPNPTTASDKPELAGIGNLDAAEGTNDPTPEELAAIAAKIVPSAEGATEQQAKDAAQQVVRETGGPIQTEDSAKGSTAKPKSK